MAEKPEQPRGDETLQHPLIRQVGDLVSAVAGVRLLVVHPTASGWGQVFGDSRADLTPAFCRTVQSTPEGARHCRMCHVLMSVAACSGGPTLQRCHAGSLVMVCPAADAASPSVAVVSSCMFADPEAWKETSARGRKLGVSIPRLRAAFLNLPKLSEEQRQWLRSAMQMMSQAVQTVRRLDTLEKRLQQASGAAAPRAVLSELIEKPDWMGHSGEPPSKDGRQSPLLIRVTCELLRQRSDLPLTVKELAQAARMTPNHFTTLFHRSVGQPFSEYQTDLRMERAKKLLANPTLSINQVARLVGYEDAGYFARRFRQKTKLAPREWRDRQHMADHADRTATQRPRSAAPVPRRPPEDRTTGSGRDRSERAASKEA